MLFILGWWFGGTTARTASGQSHGYVGARRCVPWVSGLMPLGRDSVHARFCEMFVLIVGSIESESDPEHG